MNQCERLLQGEHFEKTYGSLNHCSILNDSRYYHVGGLPADAMHDVLEGVLHYTIKVLKLFIIDQQLFSLDELNSRMEN